MDDASPSPWQFIPAEQFSPPSEPTSEAVRNSLYDLWQEIRPGQSVTQRAEELRQDLRSAPQKLLEWIAPSPQWENLGQEALDRALETWLATEPPQATMRTLVAVPHSGIDKMVDSWTKAQDWLRVQPPTPEEILHGGDEWLAHLPQARDERWVLSGLEQCYLRHYNGLILVRRLLEWLLDKRPPCLLVCDSWGWAYLSTILHVDRLLPHPQTLAPFDAPVLTHWFRQLLDQPSHGPITFRHAESGKRILGIQDEASESGEATQEGTKEEKKEPSNFLEQLAAYSRGNPGVAWAIWRRSLHIAADEEVEEVAQQAAARDSGYTVWVRPWDKLDLPVLPAGNFGAEEAFVLHTLLLHNGLSGQLLSRLLSLPASAISQSLQKLREANILTQSEGKWWVTALGYSAARSALNRAGFLVDGF